MLRRPPATVYSFLPKKHDFYVFFAVTELQYKLYQ